VEIDVTELSELVDPAERALLASQRLAEYQAVSGELSRIRREALEELNVNGLTQTEIAAMLGMTRSRIGQLLSSGPKSERAFLGAGTLTVAIGGKQEANKRGSGRVLAQEDLAAFSHMKELARTLGLDAQHEIVEPPGFIDLNRDNLVVICGPRLSPLIGQILGSDRNLGFDHDDQGWYLVDRRLGLTHRSPMDVGESRDFAYVGRLPRIDGRGTFLYIAGIHAIGAPGAVHFLENHLAELYSEVKTKRFSMLVACDFNSKTLEVTASKRLSPIYRPEGG